MLRVLTIALVIVLMGTSCTEDPRQPGSGTGSQPMKPSPAPAENARPAPAEYGLDGRPMRALVREDGLPHMVLVVREGVAPAREPGGAPCGEPLALFNQLYVMAEPVNDAFLVSTDGASDLGWVPAAACRDWPTRLALGPLDQLLVYESTDAAKRAAFGESSATAFARSSAAAAGQQFPIAETQVVRDGGKTIHLARIHFLGHLDQETRHSPTTSHSSTAAPSNSIVGSASALRERSDRLARVDIVVLMDATSSMQPFIDATKSAVTSVVTAIAGGRADVRVGLVAFRDADKESGWMSRVILPLAPIERFEQGLSGLIANAGGDENEAGYVGVDAALSTAWRADKLGQRIVLVVAQSAWHETGNGNPRGWTAESLGKRAAEEGIKIHAMHVDGASPPSSQRLAIQLHDLAAPSGGSVVRAADAQALADAINRSAVKASSIAGVRVAVLEGHARGKTLEEVSRLEGVPVGEARAAFEFLTASDCIVPPTRSDARVAAASGWVIVAVDGVPTVQTFVLARRSEITRLTMELFDLSAFADADTPAALLEWARRPRNGSYFDSSSQSNDESLASFLRGHSVYVSRASILNRTTHEVRQMPEHERKTLSDDISMRFLPRLLAVRNSDIWNGPGGTAFVAEGLFP